MPCFLPIPTTTTAVVVSWWWTDGPLPRATSRDCKSESFRDWSDRPAPAQFLIRLLVVVVAAAAVNHHPWHSSGHSQKHRTPLLFEAKPHLSSRTECCCCFASAGMSHCSTVVVVAAEHCPVLTWQTVSLTDFGNNYSCKHPFRLHFYEDPEYLATSSRHLPLQQDRVWRRLLLLVTLFGLRWSATATRANKEFQTRKMDCCCCWLLVELLS